MVRRYNHPMARTNLAITNEKYSYRDYQKWDETKRYEIINGEVYTMSAPNLWHQRTLGDLFFQLKQFLNEKQCEVFVSPFDVRLFPKKDESDDVIVQPDITVICDKEKLSDGKACRGAPDFIIEIESPATKYMDRHVKKDLYLKAGVREYWIINASKVFTYVLKNSAFIESEYKIKASAKTEIPISILEDCTITL